MCCIIGSTNPVIRMYILMLDTRNVEQTKYVLCTLKNIYSSRCSHIAVHGWSEVEVNSIGNAVVYIQSQQWKRNVRIALRSQLTSES